MTSPSYCTLDGDGASVAPYRPDVDDVGGGAFVDSAAAPPIPDEMPMAADFNQISKLTPRAIRQCSALEFTIHFYSAGTPTIDQVICLTDGFGVSDLTIDYPGTGHTTISWDAGSIPTGRRFPKATANTAAGHVASVVQTGTQVDVYTFLSGSASECAVTVEIDGEL
jgi:hypothetical protein